MRRFLAPMVAGLVLFGGPVPGQAGPRRGAVLKLRLDDRALVKALASERVRRARWIRLYGGRLSRHGMLHLLHSPAAKKLIELDLSFSSAGAWAAPLIAQSPQLSNLRSLNLDNSDATPEALREVLASRHLHGLQELAFSVYGTDRWSRQRWLQVFGVTRPANLRRLEAQIYVGKHGEAFFEQPWLAGVRVLDLRDSFVLERGVAAIARSPHLRNLRVLRLEEPLSPVAARALARSPNARRLRHLELTIGHVKDEGLEAIAGSPNFRRLRKLSLIFNDLTVRGIRALARSRHLRLRTLVLNTNFLGADSIRLLVRARSLRGLRVLRLPGNSFGLRGLRLLARARHWRHLRELDLGGNELGDRGARLFARHARFPRLRELSFFDNDVFDEGRRALKRSPGLRSVRKLYTGHPVVMH